MHVWIEVLISIRSHSSQLLADEIHCSSVRDVTVSSIFTRISRIRRIAQSRWLSQGSSTGLVACIFPYARRQLPRCAVAIDRGAGLQPKMPFSVTPIPITAIGHCRATYRGEGIRQRSGARLKQNRIITDSTKHSCSSRYLLALVTSSTNCNHVLSQEHSA